MAFSRTFYQVFGTVIHKNSYKAGDTFQFDPSKIEGLCTTFVTAGRSTLVDNTTSQAYPEEYTAGKFIRALEYPSTSFTENVIEDLEIFCYAPPSNDNIVVAPFSPLYLAQGTNTTLLVGTKLFLCRGTLIINGNGITGPIPISLTTGDKVVTANTECYGLLFNETL